MDTEYLEFTAFISDFGSYFDVDGEETSTLNELNITKESFIDFLVECYNATNRDIDRIELNFDEFRTLLQIYNLITQ